VYPLLSIKVPLVDVLKPKNSVIVKEDGPLNQSKLFYLYYKMPKLMLKLKD